MNVLESSFSEGSNGEGLGSALIGAIWGLEPRLLASASDLLETYVELVHIQTPNELKLKTHQDAVDVVAFVRCRTSKSIASIQRDIEADQPRWLGPSANAAASAVSFALRTAFLVDDSLIQQRDREVKEAIATVFAPSTTVSTQAKLAFHLNEESLRHMGFKPVRTPLLSKHLYLDLRTRTVWLFPYAEFLQALLKNNGGRQVDFEWQVLRKLIWNHSKDLYPPGFLDETLRTLRLLEIDRNAQPPRWSIIKARSRPRDIELGYGGPVSYELNSYHFWQDRLAALDDAYQQAKPVSLMQWWRDRRDTSQWTNLRLAVAAIILTLFFGLIQSVTGIISAVAAYQGQSSRPL